MPIIVQTAQRKRRELSIYGLDYDTRDGTGERDYIRRRLSAWALQALDIFQIYVFRYLILVQGAVRL